MVRCFATGRALESVGAGHHFQLHLFPHVPADSRGGHDVPHLDLHFERDAGLRRAAHFCGPSRRSHWEPGQPPKRKKRLWFIKQTCSQSSRFTKVPLLVLHYLSFAACSFVYMCVMN